MYPKSVIVKIKLNFKSTNIEFDREMSYQKLITSEDDNFEEDSKTVCRKIKSNSFRNRIKSVIYPSSLNSNGRYTETCHSLPNSPKKCNISFFRFNGRKKGDSEERLLIQNGEEEDLLELQG